MSLLSEFIELYELSTDRRVIALERTLATARERGLAELAEHVDDALDAVRATRELEQEWEESRSRRSGVRAVEIDRRIDALLARLYAVLEGFAGLDDDVGERAGELCDTLFPVGLSGHVHRPHTEQVHENERVVRTMRGEDFADDLARFRLGPFVDRLADLNGQFREVLHEAAEETVSFAAVRSSRARDHEVLLQIVARVLGRYPTQDDHDVAARDALLAGVLDQQEHARTGWNAPFKTVTPALDPDDSHLLDEP